MNEQKIDSNDDPKESFRAEKLKFVSENIASLDDETLDTIAGGMSTCIHFTCGVCTSTRDSKSIGKEEVE
jgi:hypothetical protein